VNDTVYIGSGYGGPSPSSDTHEVYALNATDGTERWTHGLSGEIDSGPAYADGILYVASRGGDLAALNATTGNEVWNVTGSDFRGSPVVVGNTVYVSDFGNGTVHAFDADDGTQRWEYVSPEGTLYATPFVWNNFVYYGSGSHLWAVEQPAPSISNVNLTNPSGQDVTITFDSDTQLTNASVSLSGPESATLTETDFSESSSGGTYTYTYTYSGSSDGTYTATVDTAEGSGGVDGATGESDSVLVDTTPPTADAGANGSVPFDSAASFDGTNSTDNDQIASYSWDFGDGNTTTGSTVSHTYGTAGDFTVTLTVTDASGNSDSDTITVTAEDTAAPTAEAGSNQTVAEDTSVSFDGSSSTDNVGVTGYTWVFGDGTTATGVSPTHTYADPGTYTVTLDATDDNGNTGTDTVTITVTDATDPTAEAGANQTVGEDTVTTFDASSSTDNGQISSYSWDFGDGNTTTGVSPTHTYADPGTYTVTVTVTDAGGNTDTDTLVVTVTDATPPTAEAGSNQTVAEDTSVSFDGSSSTDNVGVTGYTWEFGDGTTATGVSPTHTYADPGTYTVTLDATDDEGNTGSDTVTITVTDATDPTADAGSNRSVPFDAAAGFNASSSTDNGQIASYSWDFGDGNTSTGSTVSHTYGTAGTFTVTLTVTDANGNTDTDTVTVTAEDTAAPTAEAGSNQTAAEDTSVDFDARSSTDNVGVTGYSWNFGDGNTTTGATPTHTYADPGTYTVTLNVTDDNGNTDTDTVTVTVSDTTDPTADAGANETTAEDTQVTFDATNSTDNGVLSYSWDFGDGNTTTGATPTHTFADPGTYSVTLTTTDAGGNTDTDTITVTVSDTTNPTAKAGSNQTVTEDTAVSFDGSSSTDNGQIVSYSWDFGDGNTTTGASPSHTYADPGNYTVTLTTTDAGGNTDTDTVTVTVSDTTAPTPNISLATATSGIGVEIPFTANGSTDNGEIASYAWKFGDNTTASGASVSHSYNASGNYTVTLTVTDTAGNTNTTAVNVSIEQDTTAPSVEVGDDETVSFGNSISLDATVSDNIGVASYSWDFGDGNTSASKSPTHTYSEPGTYTVALTVTDTSGNTATDTLIVTVNDTVSPTAVLGANRTVAEGSAVTFDASNATDDVAVTDYSWDFDDGTTATGETVSHTFTETGTHTVTVTVADADGNTDTATVTVTVEDRDSPEADISLSDANLFTDEKITLSAADATDNENITSYRWTITTPNGTVTRTGETVTYDPPVSGSYGVQITLTDAAGNTATENATFSVGTAADFEPNVSLGNVSDGVLLSNQTLVVDANVTNTGEEAATQTIGLRIDGQAVATRTVSLDGGETKRFTFRRSLSAGTYDIAIGGSNVTTLTVQDPASISVTGYDVSDSTLFTTEALLVNATVENSGGRAGTTTVSLMVDGSVAENQTVTVGANETTQITFGNRYENGTISVGVDDRQPTTVTVERPTNPEASVSITSPNASAALDSATLTVSYSIEDAATGISAVVYRIDGGSWKTVSTPLGSSLFTTAAVADGTHTIEVALRDNRGQIVATSERQVTVDTTTPSLGVSVDKTANISESNPATVSVSLSEQNRKSVTVELLADGSVVDSTDITSRVGDGSETVIVDGNASGTPLSSGTYTLRVKATDDAGNTNTTTRTVVIDAESPDLSGLSVSGGAVTDGTRYLNETTELTVTGTVTDVTSDPDTITIRAVANDSSFTTERVVEVSGNQSFSGTLNVTDAPAGTYHVVVEAADDAGNEQSSKLGTSGRFVFDDTDPTTGVAIVPINATHGRVVLTSDETLDGVPSVTVTGPGGTHSVSLSKNATAVEDNRYTGTFTFGQDGQYAVTTTATDETGNVDIATSSTNVSTNIQVNQPGFLTIEANNGAYIRLNLTTSVNNAIASLTASDTPLRELTKQFSGSGFLEGVLGSTLSNNFSTAEIGIPTSEVTMPTSLTAADVEIRRFNETAGGWESVGTTTTGQRTINGTTQQYFLANVTHFSTYGALMTDQNPPTITSTSSTPTEPTDGTYSYDTSSVTTTVNYTDDVTGINTSAVRVLFDGTPVSQQSGVSATVTTNSTTVTATGLTGSGDHNVTVVAVDEAGHSTRESVLYTVEKDTAGPTLSTKLTNGTVVPYGTDQKTITVNYSDALSGIDTASVSVELNGSTVDASAVSTTDSKLTYTLSDPAPGASYTLVVTVADEEGNSKQLTRTFSAETDTAGPRVTATSRSPSPGVDPAGGLPKYSHTTAAVTTTLSLNDTLSGVNASATTVRFGPEGSLSTVTDSALVTTDEVSYSAVGLSAETTYVLEATLEDTDGNTRTVSRKFRVVTDATGPNVTSVNYDTTPTSTSPTKFGSGVSDLTLTMPFDDGLGSVLTGQTTIAFGPEGDRSDVTANATISGGSISLPVTNLQSGTTYEVAVTLTDDAGNTKTSLVTFTVKSPAQTDTGLKAPDAALSGPDTVTVGETVTFDASDSIDNAGIVTYRWDFDGDGDTERQTTSPTTSWTYEQSGTVTATVTTIDWTGSSDSASVTVSVETTDDTNTTSSRLTVTDATLSTDAVTVGEPMNVSVTVENTENASGSESIAVTVDGETVMNRTVTVEAGGTKTVELSVTLDGAGESVVSVAGTLAGTVTVEPSNETDDSDATVTDDAADTDTPDGSTATDQPATPTAQTPAVSVSEGSDGSSVVVEEASLPDGGFVVLYDSDGNVVGKSEYLTNGTHENVEVELSESETNAETVTVKLHRDDGDQSFDTTADESYQADGSDVSVTASLDTTATPTETVTTETTTPTTTDTASSTLTDTQTDTRTSGTARKPTDSGSGPLWALVGVLLLVVVGLLVRRSSRW
jgi:PKD repeat protein